MDALDCRDKVRESRVAWETARTVSERRGSPRERRWGWRYGPRQSPSFGTSEFGRVWYAVTAVGTKKNCAFSVPRVPDHTPERRLMAESNTVDAALRVVFPSLEDRYASEKVTVS